MGKRWFALSRGQASPPVCWLREWGILVAAEILASGGALVLLWYRPNVAMTVPSPLQQRRTCLLLFALVFALAAPTIAQQGGDAYADQVVSFTPGNPASGPWNDLQRVLGLPDFNEANATGWLTLGVGGSPPDSYHTSFRKSWT